MVWYIGTPSVKLWIKTHGIVSCNPPGRATDKCVLYRSKKKYNFHAPLAQHSLNRNTQFFCANLLQGGAPQIPNDLHLHSSIYFSVFFFF